GAGTRHGPVYARLRDMGVSDRLARQWLSTHGEEQVAAKLEYVGNRKNVESMVGYLSAALAGDFGGAGEAAAPEPKSPRARRLQRLREAIAARTPTQRDADKRLFLNQLSDPVKRADFERFGWMSPLNADDIAAFWEEVSPGILEDSGAE
ncbi:MAG TPA: replication initiation protein, partial [Roseovarius nubinhibens]|nr:replication initiation protein [Roseovarius nubinhibens]